MQYAKGHAQALFNSEINLTQTISTPDVATIPKWQHRIDDIIMFKPLMKKQIRAIVDLQLTQIRNLLRDKEMNLELTDKALDWLGEQGYDPQYGARPLKRLIQKEIVNQLSKLILGGTLRKGQTIQIDEKGGLLSFKAK